LLYDGDDVDDDDDDDDDDDNYGESIKLLVVVFTCSYNRKTVMSILMISFFIQFHLQLSMECCQ